LNYLAHALLAEPHRFSIIGNVAGDLVKGRLDDHGLHPRVADGVRRHRRVDALTDANPRYRASVAAFPPQYRRVAPMVLDVMFDHFLFTDWAAHSGQDRDAFIDGVYAVLTERGAPLPEGLARRAPTWVQADWLRAYAHMDGVAAVLARLAQRARRPLPILAALQEVQRSEDTLRSAFTAVFRDVRHAVDGIAPISTCPRPCATP
jgi:acyl carrier protein phosphodiesterase